MSLAQLSIQRPTFITCVIFLMLAIGFFSIKKMGIDLFPDVTFPVISVTISYPGAGPSEMETLVSKPVEDELSTLSGIKRITSENSEGFSQIVAEFTLETDIKYAEQQIRDRVGSAKSKLPRDIKEPVIRRLDPADQEIIIYSLSTTSAALSEGELFDLADDQIKPSLQQVNQVGLVQVTGGRKREIQIALDRDKIKKRELSVGLIAERLASSGANIPEGKVNQGLQELLFRTVGEYKNIQDIKKTTVSFFGSEVPVTIQDVGEVQDTLKDEVNRAYFNGQKTILLKIFRQSGANTLAVVEAVQKRVAKLNDELKNQKGAPVLKLVRDGSIWIKVNVEDVKDSIFIGIFLTILVVFFFLGSGRSTLITGLALPNSLIGAFILMYYSGYTINIMTLLALSLSVGLLVDDAIVVRENIFRHVEMGEKPIKAALLGTSEVSLAVIATTLTVLAVFGPVAFLSGVVGQFFRQFGFTICFAMVISLFDALTIAPMLSAYFVGDVHKRAKKAKDAQSYFSVLHHLIVEVPLSKFEDFQRFLENAYTALLKKILKYPGITLILSLLVFVGSFPAFKAVPKTFLPPQDAGEFLISLDLPPGANLDYMQKVAFEVDQILRSNPEVDIASLTVGGNDGRSEVAEFYVRLIPAKQRVLNTIQFKEKLRGQLEKWSYANPKVKDFQAISAGERPFTLNFISLNQQELETVAQKAFEWLKKNPGLKDVDIDYRPGKSELQINAIPEKAHSYGVVTSLLGNELSAQVEGVIPAKFRELGREYDIRVRLMGNQRDLSQSFFKTYIPNLNSNLIKLSDVAVPFKTKGPSTIRRQDRGRLISVTGDITPGFGLGNLMAETQNYIDQELKLPPGMKSMFIGEAENFTELVSSITVAMGLGILFIYLVLSSLYESFVMPITIMCALPLALCGAFYALFLTHQSLNIYSMIGTILLLGIATKNSILLVDYAQKALLSNPDRSAAILKAGQTRLRPILMTSMALIAGMIPIAFGLNEASRQRTSMGIAIIGGLISSTLLTLLVVPAIFSYVDRFRIWSRDGLKRMIGISSGI